LSDAPVAVSLGDPAGVGPEIIVQAWRALKSSGPSFVVVGDRATLERAAGGLPVEAVSDAAHGKSIFGTTLPVLDLPLAAPAIPGVPSPGAAPSIVAWIEMGARLALGGEASALVTAPIAKALLYQAGFAFPGHTEFLGALTSPEGASRPVMMLAAADLKCALVTIHEPLSRIPRLLTTGAIVAAGRVTANALRRDFGVEHPRLAVAALNPHAGEDQTLGREEADIIAPAVRALKDEGVDASGPHPADTLFHEEARRRYDAALCMYHDQALIPVKMLDFWGGVNITLGLPIVRASPDHGVAFHIAGKGLARADSLIAALRMSAAIAARRDRG
jgi:4-hydroxythreonine-4-phosphate dehydrogenase